MKIFLPAALTGLLSVHLGAADLQVSLEIPRMSVAEYHRPYIAMWIEKPDQAIVGTVSVLYDQQQKKTEAGTTWLKDLRLWWRKAGRDLKMPVDGVSGSDPSAGCPCHLLRRSERASCRLTARLLSVRRGSCSGSRWA